MNLAPTEEQKLLIESVERFVEKDYPFETRRDLATSEDGFSRKNWATFAELGWLAIPFPEDQGGLGGSITDACLIAEQLGRGLVVEPYLWTVVLGGHLLSRGGRGDLVEQIAAGSLQTAFGFAEPTSRYNLASVETSASGDGGNWTLNGHKAVVFNAPAADTIVVTARTAGDARDEEGISLFLVDPKGDGVTLRPYPTVDGLRAAEVILEGAAGDLLGDAGGAYPLVEETIDRGIAAVCSEAAGIMHTMLAMTREYTAQRKQFGVPLSKFQVLQHRMADMFNLSEQAISLSWVSAVMAAGDDPVERARACSASKAFVGKAGRQVGQEAIQMHGGMGMTEEMPISHLFKRLTMIDTLFGNMDHHRRRYSDLLGEERFAA
jgi:alkylation response protein AidB-like acyl-CoA dehydrogenase